MTRISLPSKAFLSLVVLLLIKCEMTILEGKIVYKADHTLITTQSASSRP